MCEWMNSEIFIHDGLAFSQYSCTFTQVFMPYWNFQCKEGVTLHCGKSGRWYGPMSGNEVAHLELNQFFPVHALLCIHKAVTTIS